MSAKTYAETESVRADAAEAERNAERDRADVEPAARLAAETERDAAPARVRELEERLGS